MTEYGVYSLPGVVPPFGFETAECARKPRKSRDFRKSQSQQLLTHQHIIICCVFQKICSKSLAILSHSTSVCSSFIYFIYNMSVRVIHCNSPASLEDLYNNIYCHFLHLLRKLVNPPSSKTTSFGLAGFAHAKSHRRRNYIKEMGFKNAIRCNSSVCI